MNLREAANVAFHIKVHGLDGLSPEYIKGAMAVLERLAEREPLVKKMCDQELEDPHDGCEMCQMAKSVHDFKIGGE